MDNEGSVPEFELFRMEWLADVTIGNPTTTELGRRFANKMITQWLDAADPGTDLIFCDGAGDGGIDAAYLDRADEDADAAAGDTWYLIQSKYGATFRGTGTLLEEGQKVIDTLDGKRPKLSSLAEGLLERLTNFRSTAGDRDRVVLVFGTERSLNEAQQRALSDLRAMGRARLGADFDVEAISIETLRQRLLEEDASKKRIELDLEGHFAPSGPGLLVGSVPLPELYAFLKRYRDTTQDLDQIYEKNVRKFLGGRGKINKAIQVTLRDNPEKFGLYNNGITIVVSDIESSKLPNTLGLVEPYIVNGCQTTRTIWDVFLQRMDAGGHGTDADLESWKERAGQGVVVVKVAKVGDDGEPLLQAITRFTNSQNAVRERDFLALTNDFRSWQAEMANDHEIYLEVQRGGWDSRRALQKQKIGITQFTKWGNAADLMKVYGAGWLGEAGMAFGKNPPFLPNGAVFKRAMEADPNDARSFQAEDFVCRLLA